MNKKYFLFIASIASLAGIALILVSFAGSFRVTQTQIKQDTLLDSFSRDVRTASARWAKSSAALNTDAKKLISCRSAIVNVAAANPVCPALSKIEPPDRLETNLTRFAPGKKINVSVTKLSPELKTVLSTYAKAANDAKILGGTSFAKLSSQEKVTLAKKSLAILLHVQSTAKKIKKLQGPAPQKNNQKEIIKLRDLEIKFLKQSASRSNLELAAKIDTAKLVRAEMILIEATEKLKPYFTSIKNNRAALPTGSLACSRPGPIFCDEYNLVEIWGPENNRYTEDSKAIVRLDLGGNDTYLDRTATAAGDPSSCPAIDAQGGIHPERFTPECLKAFNMKINADLSGNDRYSSEIGQGLGIFLGIGALVDFTGTDSYEIGAFGQGTGVLGGGALIDLTTGVEKDTYSSLAIGQGAGLFGAGLLSDSGGDDRYSAILASQGGGILGAGALIDRVGSDQYNCLAICQSGAAGGAGMLIDGSGEDQYLGYFIEVNIGGTKVKIEIPVVIGQSAILVIGASPLVDLGGNDVYHLLNFGHGYALSGGLVSTIAYDQTDTYSVFVDSFGSDTYQSGFITVEITDASGSRLSDTSVPAPNTYGFASGYAASRFFDLSAGVDTYKVTSTKPANNKSWENTDPNSNIKTIWAAGQNTGIISGEGRDT